MRTLTHIYRHPVKGFTPEALPQVRLTPGEGLPHDRRYAIANGDIPFDPAQPKHLSKSNFVMLMRNERIAGLKTHYDDATNVLTIEHAGAPVGAGELGK